MAITLIFGGITHVIPMFFAFPWIQGTLFVALIYSHCTRMAYIHDFKQKEDTIKRPNLRSVALNMFLIYPISVIIALFAILAIPLQLIVGFFILQYAKLRMLELYYNFLDRFCDKSMFCEMEMDTDSLYMAIAADDIEGLITDIHKKLDWHEIREKD